MPCLTKKIGIMSSKKKEEKDLSWYQDRVAVSSILFDAFSVLPSLKISE